MKANPQNGQDWYLVGGLSIPFDIIPELEEQVQALAEKTFGHRELIPEAEFHASHIYFGKGPFKGMEPADRINILRELATIIAGAEHVKRIYAAIDTTKLYNGEKAPEFAFAHFCERTQMSLRADEKTLLIGDRDDEQAKAMIADFAKYRSRGTPWDYGIEISGIIDAVHFCQSHHTRMVQLADVYIFIVTHRWGSRKGWMADLLTQSLKGLDLYAHRYKDWPNR